MVQYIVQSIEICSECLSNRRFYVEEPIVKVPIRIWMDVVSTCEKGYIYGDDLFKIIKMVVKNVKTGNIVEVFNFSILSKPNIKPRDSFVKDVIIKKNHVGTRGECPNVKLFVEIECEVVLQGFGIFEIHVEKLS